MNETTKELPLYIPPMIPDNNDFISGIGTKEIYILGIGFGITVIEIFICYAISGSLVVSILVPFLFFAVLFVCIRRDQYEESLIDKLMYIRRYHKSQKKFEYLYHDELGLFLEGLIEESEREQ